MLTIERSYGLADEVAKSGVTCVDKEASVLAASKLMRASGATQLLVIDATGGVFLAMGVVTAGDIVTRVCATGLDPAVLTAGDIMRLVSQDKRRLPPESVQGTEPEAVRERGTAAATDILATVSRARAAP